jgi:hypothetical protein
MFTKRLILFRILIALMILVTAFSFPQQSAQAQVRTQTSAIEPQASLFCHEDQYFLYDNGKWYCISKWAEDRTSCHGGNPWSLQEDEAHAGLVSHPTRNDGEICLQCHPQDAPAYIETFDEITGIKLVEVKSTYQPRLASEESIQTFPSNLAEMDEKWASPWVIVGAVFAFGIWLSLVTWTRLQ